MSDQTKRPESAPVEKDVTLSIADFDRLTAIHEDLREADLFLELRDIVIGDEPWRAEALILVAHERLRDALGPLEELHRQLLARLERLSAEADRDGDR